MKPAIAPTSPKNKPSVPPAARLPDGQSPVAEVWQHGPLLQPTRIPWGRIFFVVLAVSLISGIGLTVGAVWLQRYGPTGWWTRWLPVVTTTVVQQTNSRPTSDAPRAVQDFAETLIGLSVRHTEDQAYGQEDLVSLAVPLSDNGWMATLQRPPASDQTPLVALPLNDQVREVTAWQLDPASPLVFAQSGATNDAPATLGDITESLDQPVWVLGRVIRDQEIVQRRIIGSRTPTWPSSDRLERTYQLDTPVNTATGAVVVNAAGHVLGFVDGEQNVWPVQSLQSVLKNLIQQGIVERTSLGLRYRRRDELIIPNVPTAAGWVVGAGPDQVAIEENSAADRAGLASGDIIIAIDGQTVQGDIFDALQRWLPGEKITLTIERDSSERQVIVQFSAWRP